MVVFSQYLNKYTSYSFNNFIRNLDFNFPVRKTHIWKTLKCKAAFGLSSHDSRDI
jgi:hypothetical protein